jgi:murein DD-endopeptidase MepM/ murein hydrolase activator NlpD
MGKKGKPLKNKSKLFSIITILWEKISQKVTIVLIPHHTSPPLKICVSLPFLLFLSAVWVFFTITAIYTFLETSNYWGLKGHNLLLQAKTLYLAHQVRQTRELLDRIYILEERLRKLLKLGSPETIINEGGKDYTGTNTGGPTTQDQEIIKKLIEGRINELTLEEIHYEGELLKQEIETRLRSFKKVEEYLREQKKLLDATPNIWPVKGIITSYYGSRKHPWGYEDFHPGIDIAAERDTPIRATANGVVSYCGWEGGYGRLVVIEHGFGYVSLYAHCQKIYVKPGDKVTRGKVIATVGSSGRATGPHLHYEIRVKGVPVNPLQYLCKRR